MTANAILKHFITWCVGAVCGGLFFYVMFNPAANQMLAAETHLSEQIQDIYSRGTILHELPEQLQPASAGPEIPLLHGAISLRLNIASVAPQLGPGKTWYIPMKVRPQFYGDASHTQVFYLDTQTHQLTGPFSPSAVPEIAASVPQ